MTMKTYDFQKNMFYERYGSSVSAPNIVHSRSAGRVVLAFNYGVFGDNMPVIWVKRLGKKKE
jgi:hypothetical protein